MNCSHSGPSRAHFTFAFAARYCSLSFAAWVGSIPLSAKYFHLFSPISTPANIIAVPLGTLRPDEQPRRTGLRRMVSVGDRTVQSQRVVLHVGHDESQRARDPNFPASYFYVPAPSWVSIGNLLFHPRRHFERLVEYIAKKISGAAMLLLMSTIYLWHWERSRDETEFTVLPLNGGHAFSWTPPEERMTGS